MGKYKILIYVVLRNFQNFPYSDMRACSERGLSAQKLVNFLFQSLMKFYRDI